MIVIFSGAQDMVKRACYEIFWNSHHFFVLFFLCLLAHGRVFYQWLFVPLALYLAERIFRVYRGNTVFFVKSVRWAPPVMQLKFYPKNREAFQFREGQYLYVNAPTISKQEWHPFTISSAVGDLDKHGFVSVHIRRIPGGWTEQLMLYFGQLARGTPILKNGKVVSYEAYDFKPQKYDKNGRLIQGMYTGPDGLPLIKIDGPHSAPAQHYSHYKAVMMIGAGIGLTPCASVLRAIMRHKWQYGFSPEILQFYWVVRHSEIESFTWFVELLHELSRDVANFRKSGSITTQYCQINIYVTRKPKGKTTYDARKLGKHDSVRRNVDQEGKMKNMAGADVSIGFTKAKLMETLLNPPSSSKHHNKIMDLGAKAPNRLQDIFVWDGRPQWDQIFSRLVWRAGLRVEERGSEGVRE